MLEPLNVSRETFEDFEEYSSLILSRNKKINLIGRETEKIVRHRHIIDSAQYLILLIKMRKYALTLDQALAFPA